jgi:hypothetical protein
MQNWYSMRKVYLSASGYLPHKYIRHYLVSGYFAAAVVSEKTMHAERSQ